MSGARRAHVSPAADGGAYRPSPCTPPLAAGEFECLEPRIEVLISWGDGYLLHVAHVTAAHGFVLGDAPAADGGGADYAIDAESLGCERVPLVLDWNGQPAFTIPKGAQGWLELAGERITFSELAAQGLLHPMPGCDGARQSALPRAARAHIEIGQLTFSLRCVMAAQRVGLDGRATPDLRYQLWALASGILHLVILLWLYLLPVPIALELDGRTPTRWPRASAGTGRGPLARLVQLRGLDTKLLVRTAAVSGTRQAPDAGRRGDAPDRPQPPDLGDVRYCYERALAARPDLTGRVAIAFVIAPSGLVQAAVVRETDLRAPALEQCITASVRRWTFPQPRDGGMVRATYPFTLMPGS